jgi:hypothetical protein
VSPVTGVVLRRHNPEAGPSHDGKVQDAPADFITETLVEAHSHHQHHHPHAPAASSLDRTALAATLHCLAGCAVGEVLGMVVGTALGWSNLATIVLAIALAFVSGYLFTMIPLVRAGLALGAATRIALAADTVSITIMEIVDNLVMLVIPGAMNAGLDSLRFWGSLAASLAIAGVVAYPANRWLIARGRGHAVVHAHH